MITLAQGGDILKLTPYFEKRYIFNLKHLFQEKAKEARGQSFDKKVTSLYDSVTLNLTTQEDILYNNKREELAFETVTHKQIYEATLITLNRDHHSTTKWALKLNTVISWDKVWENVHNFLGTNETKTVIWQQIHLNFYTQYSYNKWHKVNDKCPLCHKVPKTVFHIMLECDVTNNLWNDIKHLLNRLHLSEIYDEENAMGIFTGKNTGIILRNWITFLLRRCIADLEREAYHKPKIDTEKKIKRNLNRMVNLEINRKIFRLRHENRLASFEKNFLHGKVLCEKHGEQDYMIRNVFT